MFTIFFSIIVTLFLLGADEWDYVLGGPIGKILRTIFLKGFPF